MHAKCGLKETIPLEKVFDFVRILFVLVKTKMNHNNI